MAFSPERMIELLGFRPFVVLTDSMDPVIKPDDLIILKDAIEEELKVDDIITFEVYIADIGETSFVTHYIAKIEEINGTTIYRTRGIKIPEDQYELWYDDLGNPIFITLDDIVGEYVFRVPYFGYIQKGLTNPIIVGLLLVNGGIIYLLYRYLKGHNNDLEEDLDE
jgi:signal peptidase